MNRVANGMRPYCRANPIILTLAAAVVLAACPSDSDEASAPAVVSTAPTDGQLDVSPTAAIVITFSEAMDRPATEAAWTISPATAGMFSWSLDDTALTFQPDTDLTAGQQYAVTITDSAMSAAGRPLDPAHAFVFTVASAADTTPPTVVSTSPAANATEVAAGTTIAVTFSEAIDAASATSAFTLAPGDATLAPSWNAARTVATLTPAAALAAGTRHTLTISTDVEDDAGNALAAAFTLTFDTAAATVDTTPPTVISVAPADAADDVPVDTAVVITFSEAMARPATEGALTLTPSVTGTMSWSSDSTTLTLTPAASLQDDRDYTISVSTAAVDAHGNALEAAFTSTFSTVDLTAPTVAGVTPADAATNVRVDAVIALTFSEPMATSATEAAFALTPTTAGTFAWSADDTVLTFTPDAALALDTAYTTTLATTATDRGGNALTAAFSASFTTAAAVDSTPPEVDTVTPSNGAVDVSTDTAVTVTFSEPMNTTATEAAFGLSPGPGGTFAWSGGDRTLTFTPNSALDETVSYAITVADSAADLYGNTLAATFSASFTTGDFTAPTVVSVVPAGAATGVPTNTGVTLTFSEPMATAATEGAFSITPTVAGTFAWSNSDTTLTFTPSAALAVNTSYTIGLSTAAVDLHGNALSTALSSGFMTGAAADTTPPTVVGNVPADSAVDVPLDQAVTITFSEAMSTSQTIDAVTISPATATTAAWTQGNTVLTLTPSTALASDTAYTVTVGTSARDAAGNTLAAAHGFGFETRAVTTPTVVTTAPADDATDVSPASDIVVTFSEAMKRAPTEGALTASPTIVGAKSWSAGDTVLTLTPSANLAEKTDYTVTVDTAAVSAAGQPLAANVEFRFETADITAPGVTSHVPADNATVVALDTSIRVLFDEPMDRTATEGAFTITPSVAGAFSWHNFDKELRFTPTTDLGAATTYTVGVAATATDTSGNALAAALSFSFTSGDTAPPDVALTSPADQADDVDIDAPIVITFTEAMTRATTEAAFQIFPSTSGSFGWSAADTVLTFTPDAPLDSLTTYTVTVNKSATDLASETLVAKRTFSFTTEDAEAPTVKAHFPKSNAQNVPNNATVSIEFSEPMATTVTAAAFAIAPDITGTKTWSDNDKTLTFTPTAALTSETTYTVTLGITATDVAGNALEAPLSFSFTAGDTVAPEVTSTSPADNATGVAVDTAIVITFSDEMDTSTVSVAGGAFEIEPFVSTTRTFNTPGRDTFTFFPKTTLEGETLYTVTISPAAKDAGGNALASAFVFSFTTGSDGPPQVVNTDPKQGDDRVAIDTPILFNFSEKMDRDATEGAFSITPSASGSFVWALEDRRVRFYPDAPLAGETVYTVTLGTGAKDVEQVSLEEPVSFSFTTREDIPPTVTSITPTGTGVATDSAIVVTFSERMNPPSVNDALNITPSVSVSREWSNTNSVLTLTPSSPLDGSTLYTVTLGTEATDFAGNALVAEVTHQFTTGAGDTTPPTVTSIVPTGTGVSVLPTIVVTFSESMDSVPTGAAVTLSPDPPRGLVFPQWTSPTTISLVLSGSLAEHTQYTVTVGTGAVDLSGNHLAQEVTHRFTTGASTAPTVTSSVPAHETVAAVDTAIVLTFSVAMDPSSFTSNGESSGILAACNPLGAAAPALVTGTPVWSAGDTVLTFTPDSDLPLSAVCALHANGDSATGVPMDSPFEILFATTDDTAPTVVDRSPSIEDGDQPVEPSTDVVITFDRPMAATVADGVVVTGPGDVEITPTSATLSASLLSFNTILTLDLPLASETLYTVTLDASEITSAAGVALAADVVFTFRTIDETPPTVVSTIPASGATDVARTEPLVVTFSEPMNTGSATQVVVSPAVTLTGSWSDGDMTLTSAPPAAGFAPGVTYTATVESSSRDANGVLIAQAYEWTFTTAQTPVAAFRAQVGMGSVTLTWRNPADVGFDEVLILRRADTFPTGADDGAATVVYVGPDESVVDGSLVDGQTYRYAAYARDAADHPSPGVTVTATPGTWAQVEAPTGSDRWALHADGTLWFWGRDPDEKVPGIPAGHDLAPRPVLPGHTFVQVSSAETFVVALDDTGQVWVWGACDGGCGDDSVEALEPVKVCAVGGCGGGTLDDVTRIAAGKQHVYALREDGTIASWGVNDRGDGLLNILGVNDWTVTTSAVPVQVCTGSAGSLEGCQPLAGVVDIASGREHGMALLADGTVKAWGSNAASQLGVGCEELCIFDGLQTVIKTDSAQLTGIVAISSRADHTLALDSDGRVWGWGAGGDGQIGVVALDNQSRAIAVCKATGCDDGQLSDIVAISAGDQHSLALASDGTVLAWGRNADGQLGDMGESSASLPVEVCADSACVAPLADVQGIFAGGDTSWVIGADGAARGWGAAPFRSFGTATRDDCSGHPCFTAPVQVGDQLAAAGGATLLRRANGTLWTWGQRGVGAGSGYVDEPERVGVSSQWAEVRTFQRSAVGVRNDRSVWGWGNGSGGQLGFDVATSSDTPVALCATVEDPGGGDVCTASLGDAVHADTGWKHTLVLTSDGGVLSLGDNQGGALGRAETGALIDSVPAPVVADDGTTPLAGVRDISAGYAINAAITWAGVVWVWGAANASQLPLSSTSSCGGFGCVSPPTVGLAQSVTWRQVEVGAGRGFAIDDSGDLWAWGNNDSGALGDGTETTTTPDGSVDTTPPPVAVCAVGEAAPCSAQLSGVVDVATAGWGTSSGSFTLALLDDGKVVAWGDNAAGQLGQGAAGPAKSLVPVYVCATDDPSCAPLTEVIAISVGQSHAVAVRRDGTVWAWGSGTLGKLGNGGTASSPLPVRVSLP